MVFMTKGSKVHYLFDSAWALRRPVVMMMMMELPPPSRHDVQRRLILLLAGDISREEASAWAEQWILSDTMISDPVTRDAIHELAGSDLRMTPSDDYMHSEVDFHEWLDKVEAAIQRED